MKKEIEIKIKLPKELFYTIAGGSEGFYLERTFGYFRDDFSNVTEGVFPRIKYLDAMGGEVIFGLKRTVSEETKYFERREIDIRSKDVSIIGDLRDMMKQLGFTREIIFEKKRKEIQKKDIVISCDQLPFGYFVEFEGEPSAIEHYIRVYNLMEQPRFTKSYLGLWEDYKTSHKILEVDCVFT